MNATATRSLTFAVAAVLLASACVDAGAAEPRRALRAMGPGWVPVPTQQLAGMRGGYQLPGGLQLGQAHHARRDAAAPQRGQHGGPFVQRQGGKGDVLHGSSGVRGANLARARKAIMSHV